MHRHELTDEQWAKVAPLLPPERPVTGRPNKDHRTILNGILWMAKTGAPWRDLPERFGPWQTVASRFYRWQHAGIWDRLLAALQPQGEVEWSLHFLDGTTVRAHQHAAGAKGGRNSKRSAGAPHHLLADGGSAPRSHPSPSVDGTRRHQRQGTRASASPSATHLRG